MIYICLFILLLYIVSVIVHDTTSIYIALTQKEIPKQTKRQAAVSGSTTTYNEGVSEQLDMQEIRDKQDGGKTIMQKEAERGDVIIGTTQSANSQYIRASYLNDDFLVMGQCSKTIGCCRTLCD